MADGKLQIITLNSQASSVSSSPAPATAQPQTATPQPTQVPRPALSIRPQQTIMVTLPSSSASSTPTISQNRLVIPAQMGSNVAVASTPSVPTVRQVLVSSVAGATPAKQIIINRPGGPQVISAQNLATVLGNQANQILSGSSGNSLPSTPSLNSAVIISAPQLVSNPTSVNSLVSNPQPSVLLSSLNSQNNQSGQQTIISTLKPLGQTASTTSTVTTTLATTNSGTSLLGGQVISGTSLLQRSTGGTSLLNLNPGSCSGGTMTVSNSVATGIQVPKLLSPASGTQILTRPLGSSQPQLVLRPGTSVITGAGGQPKIITAQQLRGLTNPSLQVKPATTAAMSPIKNILTPTTLLPAVGGIKTFTTVRSKTPQLVTQVASPSIQQAVTPKQVLVSTTGSPSLPQSLAVVTSPEASSSVASLASPTAATSPSAGAGKYAITPQVVEQGNFRINLLPPSCPVGIVKFWHKQSH